MRILILAGLTALLLALPLTAGEPTGREIEQAYRLAGDAHKTLGTGNVEKARRQLEKALALAPDLPEAHIGQGHLAMQERRFEDALASYRRALDGYENMGDILLDIRVRRYGEIQQRIQRTQEKILALNDQLNNTNPTDRKTQVIRASIQRLEKEVRDLSAVEYPSQETAHEPPGKVYFFIGNAQANLGWVEEALESWERCSRKNPRFAPVHNNLAVAFLAQGRLDEAREHVARAEELGLHVNPRLKEELKIPDER